jgi:nucleoside-diphosphate-sugar epimerase
MTSRRVLLTGASGFIGRHAIAPLLARGFEVHAASRHPPAPEPGLVAHAVDLLDPLVPARLLETVRPSHLLHAAWDVTPGRYWTARENLDWVAASLRLYRAFVAGGGQRIEIVGTCAEYDWTGDVLDPASTPLVPATLYGKSKLSLCQLLQEAALLDGVSLAWGRIFFLYGPHEAPERLIPSVIVPLLRGEPALVGEGLAERDFMHVADVAEALVVALDSQHVGALNIATGTTRSLRDVVLEIAVQLHRPDLVRLGARPTPAAEPPRLSATIWHLAALGFTPRFDLAAGLAQTIAWWAARTTAARLPLPQ